jgi:hypothetical protein
MVIILFQPSFIGLQGIADKTNKLRSVDKWEEFL